MHILSIQSSVAFGHAGNSAATFPLQRLGHEVWPVNTVHFSNHTGYGSFRGPVFEPETVADVIAGVAERGVLPQADLVLTGYQGSPGVAEVILDAVAQVKAANPVAKYCCDPVLGDAGKGMFVLDGIPELMRTSVVPAADIVTPNAFELAYLTGSGGDPATAIPADVRTVDAVLAAAARLRARGPEVVLVTSVEDGALVPPVAGGCDGPGDTGELFGVTDAGENAADDGGSGSGGDPVRDASVPGDSVRGDPVRGVSEYDDGSAPDLPEVVSMIAVDSSGAYRVSTPRMPLLANGAGDVTAALFAAHLLTGGIEAALARTASSMHGILAETMRRARDGARAGAVRPQGTFGVGVELALVDAQEAIAHPACEFPVERLA